MDQHAPAEVERAPEKAEQGEQDDAVDPAEAPRSFPDCQLRSRAYSSLHEALAILRALVDVDAESDVAFD